jgi:hypothetical protein
MALPADYLALLESLYQFLDQRKVKYVATIGELIQNYRDTSDAGALKSSARSLLGGMGTLNDIVIDRRNGDVTDDEDKDNEELEKFRERLEELLKTDGFYKS